MIGKIRFADDEQTGHVAHQIVIHPETTHRVVHRRVNAHRHLVSVLAGDFFIDLEEVSIALAYCVFTEPFDRIGKLEINAASSWTDAAAFVANFLRCTR